MMTSRLRRQRCAGFTLVEILAVVAIIAILAGIMLGMSGFASGKADRNRAMADIEKIRNAFESYRLERNYYPQFIVTNVDSWITISNELFNVLGNRFSRTDFRTLDPWGRVYQYSYDKAQSRFTYQVWSMGPNANDPADDVNPAKDGYK